MSKSNGGQGNGDWRRLLRKLAAVCAEDRKRWRASDARHAAHDRRFDEIVATVRQQGVQIQQALAEIHRQGETIREQGETLRQQGETLLKHSGHIEALVKELHTRREHPAS